MDEPTADLPFTYRLPSHVAAQIRGAAAVDAPLAERGSPRRRLVVLVLVLGLLGTGLRHRAPQRQRAGPPR